MPHTTALQAHVDAGFARATGNIILHYDAPASPFLSLRDAICASYGYQDEIDGDGVEPADARIVGAQPAGGHDGEGVIDRLEPGHRAGRAATLRSTPVAIRSGTRRISTAPECDKWHRFTRSRCIAETSCITEAGRIARARPGITFRKQ